MHKNKPKDKKSDAVQISIIIPVYNCEKYIKRCIDSLTNQNLEFTELIIVDDESADNSYSIIKELQENNEHIKAFRIKHGGPTKARNFGFGKAHGKYISFVDADDWVKNNYLSEIKQIICKHKPDMIIFNFDWETNEGFKKSELLVESKNYMINEGYYEKSKLYEKIYPVIFKIRDLKLLNCRCIYKSSLLAKHYCKNEHILIGEDDCYIYENVYYANSIYFCNKSLYVYNQLNPSSITKQQERNLLNIYQTYSYIFNKLSNKEAMIDKQLYNSFILDLTYWMFSQMFNKKLIKNSIIFTKGRRCKIKSIVKKINKEELKNIYKLAKKIDQKLIDGFHYRLIVYFLKQKSLKSCFYIIKLSYPIYKLKVSRKQG